MIKKIDNKKIQVQLKRKKKDTPSKPVNQGNLGYPDKFANHINLINIL
jgi:hypothetical protein